VPVKVISERLGHANVTITLDVYSHVIPGMDEQAASTVASLILGDVGASAQASTDKSCQRRRTTIWRRGGERATALLNWCVGEGT
jgi:hypothetical protein